MIITLGGCVTYFLMWTLSVGVPYWACSAGEWDCEYVRAGIDG